MCSDTVGVLRLDRNRIPELLQGAEPERSIRLEELSVELDLDGRDSLIALWQLDVSGRRSSLPNLLLGSEQTLADALAWSRSFLTGTGPLSGLMRVMSVREFSQWRKSNFPQTVPSIGGIARAVAIVCGEICARQGGAAEEDNISVARAASTLSFALFRGAISTPYIDPREIARRWLVVHNDANDHSQGRITDLVVEMVDENVRSWALRMRDGPESGFIDSSDLFTESGRGFSLPIDLPLAVRNILPEALWRYADRLTAEDIVELADKALPDLVRLSSTYPKESAAVIAKIASLASLEFTNQLELVRSALPSLPEVPVWMGHFLSFQSPGSIQSINSGAGWKIAARLEAVPNVFALPSCDLSWFEFELQRETSGPRRRSVTQARRAIEIIPGVTTAGPTVSAARKSESSYGARGGKKQNLRDRGPADLIIAAERSLEDAMSALRMFRRER